VFLLAIRLYMWHFSTTDAILGYDSSEIW